MGQVKAIIAALIGAALTGCVPLSREPIGNRYVALGSSYAAGTAIGGIKPGSPERCGRSPQNYAALLARRMNLTLDDQSCGGATTAHLLGPWNELPAQLDAVDARARLVTVTIGGNDLNYVMNLAAASCRPAEGLVYQGKHLPCPQLQPPGPADFVRLESNLRAIAGTVHRRAPHARLVFVQYVRLVPDQPCAALHLSPEGALATRTIGDQLAAVTRRVALETGALVLSSDELSRDHTACSAQPWSVGPAPVGPDGNAPWHPNAAGHAALADALYRLLRGAAA